MLSVILNYLCFQEFLHPYLVWIALVPWFLALKDTKGRSGFFVSFSYGFLIWLCSAWWIKKGAQQWVNPSETLAWTITVLFCLYHAIPYALFGLYQGIYGINSPHISACRNAIILTAFVYIYPAIFLGSIANSLYNQPLFIQVADIGGVPLLFFVIVFFNGLVADCFVRFRTKDSFYKRAALAVMIAASVSIYGAYRLHEQANLCKNAGTKDMILVLSIQPNLPIRYNYIATTGRGGELDKAADFTLEQATRFMEAEMVVWPEIPPTLACMDKNTEGPFRSFLEKLGRPFLYACVEPVPENDLDSGRKSIQGDRRSFPQKQYNTAMLVSSRSDYRPSYRKIGLFPFAEYLPFEEECSALRRIMPNVAHYNPGKEIVIFEIDGGKKIIPSLCYETLSSDLIQRGVEKGGNIVVSMADDAWFGNSPAAKMHLSLVLFRTIENRVPMVRVTNSGYGAFIQASGEIVPGTITPLFKRTATSSLLFLWGRDLLFII